MFFVGPAVTLIDGRITVIGIISFRLEDNCTGTTPKAFFRVSHQVEWIRKNTDASKWECNNQTNS